MDKYTKYEQGDEVTISTSDQYNGDTGIVTTQEPPLIDEPTYGVNTSTGFAVFSSTELSPVQK